MIKLKIRKMRQRTGINGQPILLSGYYYIDFPDRRQGYRDLAEAKQALAAYKKALAEKYSLSATYRKLRANS